MVLNGNPPKPIQLFPASSGFNTPKIRAYPLILIVGVWEGMCTILHSVGFNSFLSFFLLSFLLQKIKMLWERYIFVALFNNQAKY